jgi:hypothetical protein
VDSIAITTLRPLVLLFAILYPYDSRSSRSLAFSKGHALRSESRASSMPEVVRLTFRVRDFRSSCSMSGSSSVGGVSTPVLDPSDSVAPYMRGAGDFVTVVVIVVVTPSAGAYAPPESSRLKSAGLKVSSSLPVATLKACSSKSVKSVTGYE